MNVLLNFGVTGVSILLHVTIEIRGDRRINPVTRAIEIWSDRDIDVTRTVRKFGMSDSR